MAFKDKNVTKIKDFKLVIESILKKMFDVNLEGTGVKRIYVDLNSAISIVFRYEDISNEELLTILGDTLELFITKHLEEGLTINILYTLAPSAVHRHIYPNWCNEREERVSILKSDFIKKLLMSLHMFSKEKNVNSIKIVNCENIHPVMVVWQMDKGFVNRSLVLSRDKVFHSALCAKSSMVLYNGVEWIAFNDVTFNTPSQLQLTDPYNTVAHYMTLVGDARNEFKGKEGYGPVKSHKYVESNRLKLKTGIDHPLKEHIEKHLPLYDIAKMLEVAKELKLDIKKISEK